jgi:DNA (cytosine-5)-methyltransferase 1
MDKFRLLSLFSGIGGFELGLERSGYFETVAQCEIDPFCNKVLAKHWPNVKRYDDVRTIGADRLVRECGRIDAICGGFPCQDASIANTGGTGSQGSRTGLFRDGLRIAREMDAQYILLENVPELLNRGFGDVLGTLAEMRFNAEWDCFSASDIGFDHARERLYVVAYPECAGREGFKQNRGILGRARASLTKFSNAPSIARYAMVSGECALRNANGLSAGMERRRLHGLGNAVVPQIPELIGRAIGEYETRSSFSQAAQDIRHKQPYHHR